MFDPANDLAPPPSSPTVSSLSSSDLDTESTGSFFHDRSTTLGTLMGVTLQAITFRASSQHRHQQQQQQQENLSHPSASSRRSKNGNNPRKTRAAAAAAAAARQRRRWWRLCRDDADARRASLGEYLEVERRFGGGSAVELDQELLVQEAHTNGRALFADGRVLPPADHEESSPAVLCRFSAVERCCSLVL
ncbi:uncharacterized protein At3g17950 [Andrographis paniculata]|uniref:uncharacterized protein At3g17950 n=1 Tax=Andrographis paniculata TaxID=175694 RepID=UPI0021E828A4|nr:uncharacterized protein At3g17950 [Andrographis paniculata]